MNLATIKIHVQNQLTAAGIPDAAREAALVMALALKTERINLLVDRALSDDEVQAIAAVATRRAAHEPLDRIAGNRGFYGLEFTLSEATLSPRADTEALVELVLAHSAKPDARILDLGTGTGCILCALLHARPQAQGIGVDISRAAAQQATDNAAALGLGAHAQFIVSNWFDHVPGMFDIIVSNPPYIRSDDIPQLDIEVKDHDPMAALDGGTDGLDAYRIILAHAAAHLNVGGLLAVEIGAGQGDDVRAIAAAQGWRLLAEKADLAGVLRALAFTR